MALWLLWLHEATSSPSRPASNQSRTWSDIENEGKPKTKEISQTRLGSLNLSPEVSTTLSAGTKSSGEQRCKKTSLLLEISLNGLILNITIPPGIFIKAFMSKVTQTQRI